MNQKGFCSTVCSLISKVLNIKLIVKVMLIRLIIYTVHYYNEKKIEALKEIIVNYEKRLELAQRIIQKCDTDLNKAKEILKKHKIDVKFD